MDKVLTHIQNAIQTYGREIIAERRIIYLLADYGVLKDLPAERHILMDIINEGYAEQLLALSPDRQDNSLRICAFIAEIHKKTGYQVQKLITVFKWLSNGLGITTVPFETILQVEKETPIRDIIIKGTYRVKDPRSASSYYTLPVNGLFKKTSNVLPSQDTADNIIQNAKRKATEQHILYVLSQFKVEVADIDFVETTSMYFAKVTLASNIRMTKLIYLKDLIAESIASNGSRLIAPIPGTDKVGIELVKEDPIAPSFHSLFNNVPDSNELTCILGISSDGSPLSVDLTKIGHVLISGQQGSGKSSTLNTILLSLISLYYPYELKFALFDLKSSAFAAYEDIAKPFLTFSDKGVIFGDNAPSAIKLLSGLDADCSYRKKLFSKASVNSIAEYNERFLAGDLNPIDGHHFLPCMIIAIDELSELSDVPNAKGIITKLLSDGAQLGIHIIAATRQRIRRNILSEEMKKAFQGRISFRQETSIDSKSLLETPDATNLFAVGDGLFLDTTSSTLSRFSSPCIDLNMKKFLFQFISSQPSCSETYMLDVSNKISTTLSADVPVDSATDDLIPQAVEILLHSEKCNEAAIQKALGYSFNTAHRILLRLDELGITKKNGNVRTLQLNDISQIESYLQ